MKDGEWLRQRNNYVNDLINSRLAELEALCKKHAQTLGHKKLIAKAKKYSDSKNDKDLKGFYRGCKRLLDGDFYTLASIYIAAKGFYDVLRLRIRIKVRENHVIGIDSNDLFMAEMVNALDWYARAQFYDFVGNSQKEQSTLFRRLIADERDREIAQALTKKAGAKGGRSKHGKLKAEAIRLAQNYPNLPSRAIARKIYHQVDEYSEQHDLKPLSPKENHKTIAKWIDEARQKAAP